MLSQYPNFDVFKVQFQVTDALVGDLVAAAEKAGVKPDTEGLKTSDKVVRTQLKAFMARDLFKNENFYEVINELNDPLQRAIKALDSGEEFKRLKLQE
jgi:carboxyl-terminal processing protease